MNEPWEQEQLRRLKLAFRELKAEQDPFLTNEASDAFVQTSAYQEAQDRGRVLLVGRKGSGKTALILGHAARHRERYISSASLEIRADDFPLEALLGFFYADYQRGVNTIQRMFPPGSDLGSFLTPGRVAALAWRESLKAAAAYVAINELIHDAHRLDGDAAEALCAARSLIAQRAGIEPNAQIAASGSEAFYALVIYYFSNLQQQINNAIEASSNDLPTILAGITAVLSRERTPRSPIEDGISIISRELKFKDKRVLVSLDKFDDFFDQFYRKRGANLTLRHEFLLELLEGLVSRLARSDKKINSIGSICC